MSNIANRTRMEMQVRPVVNSKLKASETAQGVIIEKLGKLLNGVSITSDVINHYMTSDMYDDGLVALRWGMLRRMGADNKTCYITMLYNDGCNDDHINSLLHHLITFREVQL
ncbi:hypothetical protein JNZ24_10630 [Streptococcus suis]|uniref:hypothetical protein n=1 Tax=Streptococcus suis TaxID=1307 RepID=UPI00193174B5|nr:hypothetical protein [Streptococcus suis]MBM0273872.1 hypothetical protein [Streptococcus suis]